MGMHNLHRIMGASFQHAKGNLCPHCTHRRNAKPPYHEYEGVCIVRNKILSAPKISRKTGKPVRGRCDDYEPAPPASDD